MREVLGLKMPCFLSSPTPEPRKKVPASPEEVTALDFVKPPSEGVLNNAKLASASRGPKKHRNFFNVNFLPPTQNTPFQVPRTKKFMCLISWERTKGTHINFFGGIFGVKRGSRLRAKGTLISEPRFSTPARCDFSHARKGKWPLSRVFL